MDVFELIQDMTEVLVKEYAPNNTPQELEILAYKVLLIYLNLLPNINVLPFELENIKKGTSLAFDMIISRYINDRAMQGVKNKRIG